ncbi:hypothetical protein GUJ93_ZPchr0012g20758 [Zizania palustris]|uniref:Uncharacterized protein n=1 Tax=Zizania palustris TaxID=103762 RepID=A0A8J6BXU9_ZIZPA|nr:hypothetical protein GUJ93_ZPchr0012g20758 [Zizania palustris]
MASPRRTPYSPKRCEGGPVPRRAAVTTMITMFMEYTLLYNVFYFPILVKTWPSLNCCMHTHVCHKVSSYCMGMDSAWLIGLTTSFSIRKAVIYNPGVFCGIFVHFLRILFRKRARLNLRAKRTLSLCTNKQSRSKTRKRSCRRSSSFP